MGSLLILPERVRAAPITKTNAYCLLVLLPTRVQMSEAGLFVREIAQHWERVTSNGCVVRCHTELEAQEAAEFLTTGIQEGLWRAVAYDQYAPTRRDLPYHDWIKGMRGDMMRSHGISPEDLPETHDPALTRMSDEDWLRNGPR